MYRPVHFSYSGKNEWKFDDDGNPVRPGARDLAERVAKNIEGQGAQVSQIDQHSFYGWGFGSQFQGSVFYNVLNPVEDDCHITISLDWYWLKRLLRKRPHETFEAYCNLVSAALHATYDVSDLEWSDYFR